MTDTPVFDSVDAPELKLGKLPAKYDPKGFTFAQFEKPGLTLKYAPVGFGHQKLVPNPGMLGNDRVGDCVEAGAAHETQIWNAIAKVTVPFDDRCVIGDYSAATGYDPNDPSTDQGTYVQQYLDYRRNTGISDANGGRHFIGAYVSLEPQNWVQVLEALYIFDAVGIGFAVPATAMTQHANGQPWSVVPGTPDIIGGHYVPILGRPHVSMLDVSTWGTNQLMTKAFFKAYCDEAYGLLSVESLVNGKTAEGYDLAALNAAIKAL